MSVSQGKETPKCKFEEGKLNYYEDFPNRNDLSIQIVYFHGSE